MASVVLSTAASSVGAAMPSMAGTALSVAGKMAATAMGGLIDDAIFGVPTGHREGARLADLSVQVSTYGKVIPMVFGSVRIAGNVIWSQPIKETATTTTSRSGGGKGSGGVKSSSTTYSYSASLAIAICAGQIDEVVRVWADAKLLELEAGNYRVYQGTEDQLPDPFIEGLEGIGKTPAYRGMAYVVIEDFPLGDFGNRIPNFTFEVKKVEKPVDYNGQSAEEMVRSMVLIPGSGECVYDTQEQEHVYGEAAGNGWIEKGHREAVNRHSPTGQANALLALDQMQKTCPNLEWVSVVVNWFGTSLDAGACMVEPAVEFADGGRIEPDEWSVAGLSRGNARVISTDAEGNIRYGGTPSDAGLVRLVEEIRARGLKVMLLPMFLMDMDGKPWRGHVTGSAADVADFFTKTDGYNAFITHYATLLSGKVDAFAIGSELIGLTKVVGSAAGSYPAVDALVSLAATVRGIMGSSSVTKLTYAADWSEYHHAEGGWYHLDPLWASPNIDMIGIDAYFPLSDAPQSELGYDVEALISGWSSGEGYDWYYSDEDRTVKTTLAPEYAWKNLDYWWQNSHINPDSSYSPWVPQSKKIWFVEYGFPSVDGASNQPNVFSADDSVDGAYPYHSQGLVDFRAQRAAIVATEAKWLNSNMVERQFLWTWDARPYPYYPDLRSVWSDGSAWAKGHWITGKFGLSSLASLVEYLCKKSGLSASQIEISALTQLTDGFVVTTQKSIRSILLELMEGYFFLGIESEGCLRFVPKSGEVVATLSGDELLSDAGQGGHRLTVVRHEEHSLPRRVEVFYLSRVHDFQPMVAAAERSHVAGEAVHNLNLPVVMTESEASSIAESTLHALWAERVTYRFELDGAKYAHLEPADIIEIEETMDAGQSITHQLRVLHLLKDRGRIEVEAVSCDTQVFEASLQESEEVLREPLPFASLAHTQAEYLDLPLLPGEDANPLSGNLYVAATGSTNNWSGAVLYASGDGGANYTKQGVAEVASVMGAARTVLSATHDANLLNEVDRVEVLLKGAGELESIPLDSLLAGGNAALLGDEIIQFQTAEFLSEGHYRLSGLLRGRLGTEWAMSTHSIGERFVLLEDSLSALNINESAFGGERLYKAVTIGSTLGATDSAAQTYQAHSLRPYAPVHLQGARDASGNLTLSWIRRTRGAGGWRDGVEVPLLEATEAYEVDILDGQGEVVRTLSSTTLEVTYSAADQVADFGSAQASASLAVYQLSEAVGRGRPAEEVV